MRELVLDTGVLIGLAEGDPVVRAFLRAAYENPATSASGRVVPAVVVAESIRGSGRDTPINQFLKRSVIVATDEPGARRAGALLAEVGGNATIDALVVAVAESRPGSVLITVDDDDLRPLCAAAGVSIEVLKAR